MPSVHETAYPRLKASVAPKDLREVYTPTSDELKLASDVGRSFTARVCFLVLLKTFQRLGYFPQLQEVPDQIVSHIAKQVGGLPLALDMRAYDASGTRRRHVVIIRRHLRVSPFGDEARDTLDKAMRLAAETKEDLVDIINVGLEEGVRAVTEQKTDIRKNQAASSIICFGSRSGLSSPRATASGRVKL